MNIYKEDEKLISPTTVDQFDTLSKQWKLELETASSKRSETVCLKAACGLRGHWFQIRTKEDQHQ